MRKSEVRWAEVRVGLFVALAGAILFGVVVYVGLVGTPFARYHQVHALFPNVAGLAAGSPVELGGVVVGEISRIELPQLETGLVPVTLSVRPEAMERLSPKSRAYSASHALVGQRYVGMTTRQPGEPPLAPGSHIEVIPSKDADSLIEEAMASLKEVRGLVEDLRSLTRPLAEVGASLEAGQGTLGKLLKDEALYTRLEETTAQLHHATRRLSEGEGLLATLLEDRQLAGDVRSTARSLARTTRKVERGEGALGKLVADEQAGKTLERTLAQLESLTAGLGEARGALDQLVGDDAVITRMNALIAEMDALVTDVRRNPRRYLQLSPF